MLVRSQRLTARSGFGGIRERAVLPGRFPNPPAPISRGARRGNACRKKPIDGALLPAHHCRCPPRTFKPAGAADREALPHSPRGEVTFAVQTSLENSIATAGGLFLSQIEVHGNSRQKADRRGTGSRARRGGKAGAVYFSTRMKSPVEALTDTVSLAPSRLAP